MMMKAKPHARDACAHAANQNCSPPVSSDLMSAGSPWKSQEQSKGAVAVTTEPALYKAAALISWIKGVKMSNQPVINRQ